MSMVKLVSPSGWTWDTPTTSEVKIASHGMGSHDFSQFIKRAGDEFANLARDVKFEPGEVPMHEIALGSYELAGANRNGDGFKKAAHEKYHKTFEKLARSYRSHINKDKSKSYGVIKLAYYNPKMGRVELLTALNGTKEAAERNGGLIADIEIEKLARGQDIPRSMAARVSHDVCAGCGNVAKTRDDYCTDKTCKYGGCATKLAHVFDDGFMLSVDNPHPQWFDISTVYRPACRTAFGSRADYLSKTAAFTLEVPGAEMADMLNVQAPGAAQVEAVLSFLPLGFAPLIKSAAVLAEIDAMVANNLEQFSTAAANVAFAHQWRAPISQLVFSKHACDHAAQLSALADSRIVLTLTEFAKLACIRSELAITDARSRLPGVYSEFLDLVEHTGEYPNSKYSLRDKVASYGMSKSAEEISQHCSLDPMMVRSRVLRSNLRLYESPVVGASGSVSSSESAVKLAGDYAVYSISAAARTQNEPGFIGFCEALVRQNWLG